MSYKRNKDYYLNDTGEVDEESNELYNKIVSLVNLVQPNLSDTIIVNGHFIKQVTAGVKVTTYYSYAILYNTITLQLQVISYNHSDNTAQDLGLFPVQLVEAIDINNGFQTNYRFKDYDDKELFVVQTLGHEMPVSDEYQIKYFQEVNYNILRKVFYLDAYSYKNELKGGQ